MKPNLDIYEYLEELEQNNPPEIGDVSTLFTEAKTARDDSGFDTRCEVGYRIKTGDLSRGVKGNRKNERQFINFVDRGLKHKGSELMSARVEIQLKSLDGEISKSKELLESETNYVFAFLDVPRVIDACIEDMYYMNWGVVRIEWDPEADAGNNWRTGTPKITYRDPRRIYVDPYVEGGDLDKATFVFDVMKYDVEELKKMYPKHKDDIISILEDFKASDNEDIYEEITNNGVDVVIYQYKKTYQIETRVITNQETKDSRRWLEEDYQEFLKKRVKDIDADEEMALFDDLEDMSDMIDRADELAQQKEGNPIFNELIYSSQKLTKEYPVWFEMWTIPKLNLILEEPQISKYSRYAFLPADRDPDSSYPISMAYKGAPLLELYSTLLTLQMFYAVKFNKPQVMLRSGALQNESSFLKNHANPDFVPIVKDEWVENHPKEQPFEYIYPKEMGALAELLEKKLKAAIESYTRTTPAVLGLSQYSGESGKSVIAKQQSAKQGDKTDIFKLEKFYKKIVNVMKWDIAIMKEGFPHETEHLDLQDERDMVEVNTTDGNQLLESASNCYAVINIEDNAEVAAQKRKVEALELFNRSLLTPIDALKEIDPPNVDKKIQNLKQYNEALQFQELLKDLPEELKSKIMNNISQLKGQLEAETESGKSKSGDLETDKNKQGTLETEPEE